MSDFLSRINTPYDNNIMDKLKLFQLRMLFPPKNGLIIKSLLSLSEDIFFETQVIFNYIFLFSSFFFFQKLRCKESENFENSGIIIFNRMLFDGLNEALEYFKPFDIRGKNTPWNVDAKKMTFSDINKENFAIVFDQVTMKMLDWNNNQCGLIYDNYLSEEDFEIADALKEEKIENMLCNEVCDIL